MIDGDPKVDQTDAENDDAKHWLYNNITVMKKYDNFRNILRFYNDITVT
jgi:hypothetical protein